MTLKRLNEHLQLVQELRELHDIRAYLLGKAEPGAQRLDGMPRSSGPSDPTGDLGMEIADLRETIDEKEREVRASEPEVLQFIQSIPAYKIRRIFRLRYLRGLYWKEVADLAGRAQSAGNVSRIVYDYLKASPDEDQLR